MVDCHAFITIFNKLLYSVTYQPSCTILFREEPTSLLLLAAGVQSPKGRAHLDP
jgi:hypothetical protein